MGDPDYQYNMLGQVERIKQICMEFVYCINN